MMKVRVIKKSDGSISIIHPAPKSRKPQESEQEWLNRVFARATQNYKDCQFEDVEDTEIPTDRTYRNAWKKDEGKSIEIDAVKKTAIDAEIAIAKEIKDAKIAEEIQTRSTAISKLKEEGKLPSGYK